MADSGTRSTTTIAHSGSPEPVLAIQRTQTHVDVDARKARRYITSATSPLMKTDPNSVCSRQVGPPNRREIGEELLRSPVIENAIHGEILGALHRSRALEQVISGRDRKSTRLNSSH